MRKKRQKAQDKRVDFEVESMRHLDALYGAARRLTRSPADADDLVQDTFVRAFRFYDQFQAGTNMKAWLLRIQTNTFINQYRRVQRERNVFDGVLAAPVGEGVMSRSAMRGLTDPSSEAQRRIVSKEIKRAFDKLGDDARMMVVLADVEGFSYREIAEAVGCPIGTVMSRLHRARKTLQLHLIDQAIELGIVSDERENTVESEPVSLEAFRDRKAKG